jgi:serine/threonine-protein kinase
VVAAGGALAAAPVGTKAGPGEIFDAEPLPGSSGPGGPAGTAAVVATKKKHSRRRTAVIVAAVAAVVLIAGGLTAAFEAKVFTPSHPTPTVAGLTVAAAQTAVEKLHMTLKVETAVKSETVALGVVISQSPAPGTSLKEGSTVSVVPSAGPPDVAVPDLTGMTCAQADTALAAAHFKSVCAPPRYDNTIPAGQLVLWSIGSTANPKTAPYGSTITLVPSNGHAPVPVPSIPTTYTYAQAQAALQAVGLTATEATQASSTIPQGNVISTSPASGAPAAYGSAVTVTVSTGPPMVNVPNVIGDSVSQATAVLQGAGLSVSGVSGNPSHNVIGTQPSVGSSVPTGSSVQLFTSH